LAILVVIAILISVVGLFMKTGVIKTGQAIEALEPGEVRATVEANVELTLGGFPLNFGTVVPLEVKTSDIDVGGPPLTIKSTGSSSADISYWGGDTLFDNLLIGGLNAGGVADPSFQIKIVSQDCTGGLDAGWGLGAYETVLIGSGFEKDIVADCIGDASQQGIEIAFRIEVPPLEPGTGLKTSTLTFKGIEHI